MARPVTLFTGQWADLPLAELAPLARSMGYDGLELACWGDHFNVQQALASDTYVRDKWALLKAHGERYGVGVSAVAYAWVMAHPAKPIPIVGTQTPARIAEAADAFKVSFTRAEWYAILVASLGENLP